LASSALNNPSGHGFSASRTLEYSGSGSSNEHKSIPADTYNYESPHSLNGNDRHVSGIKGFHGHDSQQESPNAEYFSKSLKSQNQFGSGYSGGNFGEAFHGANSQGKSAPENQNIEGYSSHQRQQVQPLAPNNNQYERKESYDHANHDDSNKDFISDYAQHQSRDFNTDVRVHHSGEHQDHKGFDSSQSAHLRQDFQQPRSLRIDDNTYNNNGSDDRVHHDSLNKGFAYNTPGYNKNKDHDSDLRWDQSEETRDRQGFDASQSAHREIVDANDGNDNPQSAHYGKSNFEHTEGYVHSHTQPPEQEFQGNNFGSNRNRQQYSFGRRGDQPNLSGDHSGQEQPQSEIGNHQGGIGSSNPDPGTALNGALNLASQGLIAARQAECSTCGKSSYALSNAKSYSGSAIALSIGG
jgi:hypothetical protein